MKRADLQDAFDFDGSLLELSVEALDANGLCAVLGDCPLPWTFLLDGEPAPLPDPSTLQALVDEAEHSLEVQVDPGGLRLILIVNFGLPPLTATLHPNDVPDEAAFERLTRAVAALAGTTRPVRLQAEGFEHTWAVYWPSQGWGPPAPT
ncbi:hypothetical protein [Deinococcus arcticus]|uniref:Uncharacterized protein n=1 Tax=Deinococcus arcticus TaxID=2136176 RepID=A0A2T3WBU4_9DEIO|nr:hypothetical protein [Deinococcus arcticus]PTA69356.1 hypothetical protein C8263_03265 [Deinococcus arcticus]